MKFSQNASLSGFYWICHEGCKTNNKFHISSHVCLLNFIAFINVFSLNGMHIKVSIKWCTSNNFLPKSLSVCMSFMSLQMWCEAHDRDLASLGTVFLPLYLCIYCRLIRLWWHIFVICIVIPSFFQNMWNIQAYIFFTTEIGATCVMKYIIFNIVCVDALWI